MPKLTTFKLLTRKSKEFILSHGKKKKIDEDFKYNKYYFNF